MSALKQPPPARAARLALDPIAPDAAGMPLYRAVKRALLKSIEAGRVAPGDPLPSEAALSAGFGVSVGTLRRAVDDLVAEHILVRRQGRGTFVATHTSDRFLFQFFHVERGDGLREAPGVELVSFERTRLDDEAAAALNLKPGEPALQVENRLRLQGRPVVHDRLLIPAALFRGLTEKRWRERPAGFLNVLDARRKSLVTGARAAGAALFSEKPKAWMKELAPPVMAGQEQA